MKTVKTRLGTFRLTRKDAVGLSVYKAGRSMRINRQPVEVGDFFPVFHRDADVLSKPPIPRMYGSDFVARFRIDGTEIKEGSTTVNWAVEKGSMTVEWESGK